VESERMYEGIKGEYEFIKRRAQPQLRLPQPQLWLKKQQLRLATVTGNGERKRDLVSDLWR